MRPVCVFAKGPGEEIERLRADLRGQWRQASRAVMVLLSLQGLPAAQIAVLLECRPATARPAAAGRDAAGQQDRRAAGPARAVGAATDLAVPGPPAGQHADLVPAGAAGGDLATAQADCPRGPVPRPRG